ncbi:MAG: hypothetical protein CM15mP32_4720 [Flavobacteriaceae bacterium]|nr:MAG: hypothetical protein CM15mP32_4720 [Flavobacteriaceae bacterium]
MESGEKFGPNHLITLLALELMKSLMVIQIYYIISGGKGETQERWVAKN